jgi:hypothetical protein
MNILGFSHLEPFTTYYHDTNVSLAIDGAPVFSALEERYSRVKHHAGFPAGALNGLRQMTGFEVKNADVIVVPENRRQEGSGRRPLVTNSGEANWPIELFAGSIGFDGRIEYCDHQLAHASAAFRLSPFDEALVITLDGIAAEQELRWNRASTRVGEVGARIAAHDRAAPSRSQLSAGSVANLADDLRTVWQVPTTDARVKKRIVGAVIKEVVVDIDAEAGEIILLLHWTGGIHTELRLPRRRREQRDSTSQDIMTVVRQLVLIANDELIAGILNRNKLTTGRGNRWTRERVTPLRSHHKISPVDLNR